MAGLPPQLFRPIDPDLAQMEAELARLGAEAGPALRPLLNGVLLAPGKRLRPALTIACGRLFGESNRPLRFMAAAVECLHTATLIHDDVMDQPGERRGEPALYRRSGSTIALLVGDYLFAQAAIIASETNNLRIMRLFAESVAKVCAGQIEEFGRDRESRAWLTRDDYYRTIDAKTAALFVLACESGAVLGEAPLPAVGALRRYGRALGLAFQIVDDILDLVGDEALLGKPAGSDLRQGVATLPLIYLRDEIPEVTLRAAFGHDGARDEAIEEIKQVARSGRGIERAYEEARHWAADAAELLQGLPGGPYRDLLRDLTIGLVDRQA